MSKHKRATKAGPQPNSLTTLRRKNRGFVSLEVSCRIHRRALRRSNQKRTVYGYLLEAGEKKVNGQGSFMHTAGGSMKYY